MAQRSSENRKGEAESPPRQNGGLLIFVAFAVLIGGLVYLNSLDNPFAYDDRVTFVENQSLRDPGNSTRDVYRTVCLRACIRTGHERLSCIVKFQRSRRTGA